MDRQSWLAWRQSGIGSSDAPAIHGKSPYKTPLELWREKFGPLQAEKESNFAMNKGNQLEPLMRLRFSKIFSENMGREIDFQVENIVMQDFDFLRASLDGVVDIPMIGRIGLECKYMGQSTLHTLKNNGYDLRAAREDYWIQIQHQILVANLECVWFVAVSDEYLDGNNLKADPFYSRVDRDETFLAEHLKSCIKFWNPKKSPKATDKDVAEIKLGKTIAKKYIKLKNKAEYIDGQIKELREKLISLCNHPKNHCHGLSIVQSERAGSIDYSKIPELDGVDLDKYRKSPTKVWTIK